MIGFDLAQTFYMDADAVQGASTAFIHSVDLYFYSKPTAGKTKTGIEKPGVSVYVCRTTINGAPDLTLVHSDFSARVDYDSIQVSTVGATSTRFTFNRPVPVPTGASYGILIKFDGSDNDFGLWYNKAGQNVLGSTTATQVTSGKVDGSFYVITNGKDLTPERDADLSFKLNICRFTETSMTFKTTNRNYELLKVGSTSGRFIGGEPVYRTSSNATGTVSFSTTSTRIVGTGTSFSSVLTVGDTVVITDGTPGNTEFRTVTAIAGANLDVDIAPSFTNTAGHYYHTLTGYVFQYDSLTDHLVLQDTNTSATTYLAPTNIIVGVDSFAQTQVTSVIDYSINSVIPSYDVKAPVGSAVTTTVQFANSSYSLNTGTVDVVLGTRKLLNDRSYVLMSATNEKTTATPLKSFAGEITMTTTNPYVSPYVKQENLDLFLERYEINNSSSTEYKGINDSKARYISKTVRLSDDQRAEDLKVYLRGYKPASSDIKVYAKLYNAQDIESFDLKDWTELELLNTDNYISNPYNTEDYYEFTYNVPPYGTGTTSSLTYTTSTSSAVVTGSGSTVNTD
ncbi:hypothetical protein EBT25_06670, partial [bacterium]|nr:hypothetical protein [bacterium]